MFHSGFFIDPNKPDERTEIKVLFIGYDDRTLQALDPRKNTFIMSLSVTPRYPLDRDRPLHIQGTAQHHERVRALDTVEFESGDCLVQLGDYFGTFSPSALFKYVDGSTKQAVLNAMRPIPLRFEQQVARFEEQRDLIRKAQVRAEIQRMKRGLL